jgi:hypothetical protein
MHRAPSYTNVQRNKYVRRRRRVDTSAELGLVFARPPTHIQGDTLVSIAVCDASGPGGGWSCLGATATYALSSAILQAAAASR